jgi:hypothetical protein
MSFVKVLPTLAILCLSVSLAPAQAPLPGSTQTLLATLARLETMTSVDFSKLLSQAESGQREAQYLVALTYQEGRLTAKDVDTAASWMLKSAELGYPPAQVGIGALYIAGVKYGPVPQRDVAERWLRFAAVNGDADAQFWLGIAYQRDWFGAFDNQEALKWIRRAAAQGLPDAQFRLGQMYEDGEGVPQSNLSAATWYRRAADHLPLVAGVWEAETQLASMYRDSRLPKDDIQAYMWLAIVGSTVDPPDYSDMRRVARHMTKTQVAQGQRMAENWLKRHPGPADVAHSRTPR